ncbi:MAG: 2-phospho-L-lactate transferase [Chloroflexota bacterium]
MSDNGSRSGSRRSPHATDEAGKVLALAGGVGGAKMAHGLQMAIPDGALSVVVNTGDDFKLWGLHISPDIDTVTYTLSGLASKAQGWGLEGDTWQGLEMMARYGRDPWFRLGDMDMVTHVLRTQMLHEGRTLTEATRDLAQSLGIKSAILPMSDQPVETLIQTTDGDLDFQDYFVRRRHADTVTGVVFRGIDESRPTQEVIEAIGAATAVIFCPSNPVVSIGPLLAVPGMLDALQASAAPTVAVSPIVGGTALKGPAADMLLSLGHEVSPYGVAAMYKGIIDGIIIDNLDERHASRIRDMGIAVEISDTIMKSDADRRALAETALRFCRSLAG